jgi:glycosyltransferase involved in cell wall biosynthesis
MLQHLDRGKVDPSFVSLGFGHGPLLEQVAASGIAVRQLGSARFRNLRSTAERIWQLMRIIQRERIDLAFCNGGHPLLFGGPAARLAGRPCVWWVHGYFPDDPMKGHWIALAERLLKADFLVANSRHTESMLRRVFPEAGEIRVIPPAVDARRFQPLATNGLALRRQLGLTPTARIVGNFGRLHPFKGQDVFLRAAHGIAQQNGNVHFVLIGGVPYGLAADYSRQLRAQAEQPGLAGRVTFLGHRDDLNELLNACDLVVHSSVEPEPWGMVIAEAMAAGRAVIATAAGGPVEMIRDGHTGCLVQPNDPQALGQKMAALLQDKEACRRMGAAAHAEANQRWEATRAGEVFSRMLQSCAAAGPNA